MKIKVVSTIPIKQQWFDEVKGFIPDVTFEFVFTNTLPSVFYKPDMQSMYCNFNSVRAIIGPTDADARVYIMSYDQLRGLGVTNHLALYDNSDRDGVLDTYIGLNIALDDRARDNGFKSNFAWEVCHELSHGREQNLGREYLLTNGDRTHAWEAQNKLQQLWYSDTIEALQATVQKLTQILAVLLLKKKPMIHPLSLPYRNQITQQYGVENPIYTKTKRHIGCDYACPIGTILIAPADGSIIVSSHSPERGNYIQFKHGNYVLEMRHLDTREPVGTYKQGAIIAHSGNTGTLSEGPHVCVVDWNGKDGLSIINTTNWSTLTVDPNKLYV